MVGGYWGTRVGVMVMVVVVVMGYRVVMGLFGSVWPYLALFGPIMTLFGPILALFGPI